MARRRNFSAEAARRNELAREQGYSSYYRLRLARARKARPGITRAAARGHGTVDEREALRLIRLIPQLNPDSMISFTGTDRQRDGTWRVGVFDVLTDDRGDMQFRIGESGLYLLTAVANAIRDAGWANLGAQYLSEIANNNIRLRDSSPVSSERGAVFADGSRVMIGDRPAYGVDDQGVRANLNRSLSKWRRVR